MKGEPAGKILQEGSAEVPFGAPGNESTGAVSQESSEGRYAGCGLQYSRISFYEPQLCDAGMMSCQCGSTVAQSRSDHDGPAADRPLSACPFICLRNRVDPAVHQLFLTVPPDPCGCEISRTGWKESDLRHDLHPRLAVRARIHAQGCIKCFMRQRDVPPDLWSEKLFPWQGPPWWR